MRGLPLSVIQAFDQNFKPLKPDQKILICAGDDTKGIEQALLSIHRLGVEPEIYEFRKDGSWNKTKDVIPARTGAVLFAGTMPSQAIIKISEAAKNQGVQCHRPILKNGMLKHALVYLSQCREKSENGKPTSEKQKPEPHTPLATPQQPIEPVAAAAPEPVNFIPPAAAPAQEKTEQQVTEKTSEPSPLPSMDPAEAFGQLEDYLQHTAAVQTSILGILDYRDEVTQQIQTLTDTLEKKDAELEALRNQNSKLNHELSRIMHEKSGVEQLRQSAAAQLASEKSLTASLREQVKNLQSERDASQAALNDIRARLNRLNS